jgi:putative heme-binding domain-containing protein
MNKYLTTIGIGSFVLILIISLIIVSCGSSSPDIVSEGEEVAETVEEEEQEEEEAPAQNSSTQSGEAQQDIETLPGFEAQLLYEIPLESEGSWVSLGLDKDGYLIASDQRDRGTYRIKVSGDLENPEVEVERLLMPISGAQGIEWAFDHLYLNVQRPDGSGLYRLGDNRGDGLLNVLEYLGGSGYLGEHGNHAVVTTADGEGLYYAAGNFTPPPSDEEIVRNRVASWDEDLLLPRLWDARGHARGILAPAGWIARINPEATEWELISMGYRNQFDVTLNEHDELFTYDADMEWDFGTPWYRPTAIVHATSGTDFGWRSGSGKWPNYYEDKLPPLLEIGPGSPVGLISGKGASFPADYQRSLYALDWTFGTLYAIHMSPKGSSYEAEAEEFLSGAPLPLVQAVIGKDGHMYFVTGGRNQQSHLYRVIYTGDESTEPAEVVDDPAAREQRELRHHLESFHGVQDPGAVDAAWPHLASEDRILRIAARVAVEHQPVESWADRALNENRPQARITALVALARTAPSDYRDAVFSSLMDMDLSSLDADQKLGYLRAMALAIIRLGEPENQTIQQITNNLQQYLPNEDNRVNTELIRVLVRLRDSRVIDKALTLMQNETIPETEGWVDILGRSERYGSTIMQMIDNPPPVQELHYAFMLRTLSDGWTIDQRREYFEFINNASDRMGGASYTGFLEDVRRDALSHASEEEREAVSDIAGVSLAQQPDFEITAPEGPGRNWTVDEAMNVLSGHLGSGSGRDFERGRNAFFATTCAACHRFDGYGGDMGPDLSTVNRRFNNRGLVEKIIDPNILVSDQYSSTRVTLRSGETIVGLVADRADHLEIYSQDPNAEPTIVSRDDVASREHLGVSTMPPGLINPLNEDELRDLIAYINSGGDSDHPVFKTEEELAAEAEAED